MYNKRTFWIWVERGKAFTEYTIVDFFRFDAFRDGFVWKIKMFDMLRLIFKENENNGTMYSCAEMKKLLTQQFS